MTPFFHFLFCFVFRKGKGKWGDWQAPQQLTRTFLETSNKRTGSLPFRPNLMYYIVHNNGRISHRNNYKLKDGFPIEKTI
jgi:hypothetical protein